MITTINHILGIVSLFPPEIQFFPEIENQNCYTQAFHKL